MSKKLQNRKRKRANRVRKTLELYKLYDNKCQRCEMESFRVGFFDFHHIIPEEKEYNVGGLLNKSWDKVLDEAQKCLMLCPNCHRLEHIEMRENAEMMENIDVT